MCPSFGGLKTVNVLTQNPPVKLLFHSKKAISSLIFYLFFKHQFYGTQQIDFPMTQKNVVINHARQRKKKVEVLGKQYAPAFAIHRKLSQFPPPAFFSFYIF